MVQCRSGRHLFMSSAVKASQCQTATRRFRARTVYAERGLQLGFGATLGEPRPLLGRLAEASEVVGCVDKRDV